MDAPNGGRRKTEIAITPRVSSNKGRLRQASLFSLSGVVVVEELRRQRDKLADQVVDQDEKKAILSKLKAKRPATKLIIETGIGRTVKKLSKSLPEAREVYDIWRREVERREELKERGSVDVLCDADTTAWRERAKRLIASAGVGDPVAVSSIEKLLFDRTNHLLNVKYRRAVRKIVFRCKNEPVEAKKLSSALHRSKLVEACLSEASLKRN